MQNGESMERLSELVDELWNFNLTSPACTSNIVLSSKECYCIDGAMESTEQSAKTTTARLDRYLAYFGDE